MKVVHCECGADVEAETDDELVAKVEEHVQAHHPEMVGLNPEVAHETMAGLSVYHGLAQAIDAGFCHLRVLGNHRLQDAGAHFDRFLHEVVEPALFQWRKAVDKIGKRRLRTLQFQHSQPYGFLGFRAG